MLRAMLVVAFAFAASDPAHIAETDAFRKKHEEDYRRQYVPLAGLFSLKHGVNTVGSAPSNDIILPSTAPPNVGRLVVSADRVRFDPAPGARVTLKDRPVTSAIDVKSDDKGPADDLTVGAVTFWVHMSGDRRTVRLRDPNGEPARAFEGFHWFAYDERFRVAGRFIKDPTPHQVKIPNQLGDEETYTTEGIVEFTLDGRTITMRPMTTRPGRLYFIFRDGTSGKETYETARFLYSDLKDDGTTVLEFNQAYNPPCSFNPYTTCPLPPKENRLTVRILAGEKAYPHPPKNTNPVSRKSEVKSLKSKD
jgi:uncharacterized protein (DUF1684 family)